MTRIIFLILTIYFSGSNGQGGPNCFCYEELGGPDWLANPTQIQTAMDGTDRLFVSEQRGYIWIVHANGTRHGQPFVNLTGTDFKLEPANGLMGFTFHPNYTETGKVYLYYIAEPAPTQLKQRVTEVLVSGNDPHMVDISTERILMEFPLEIPDHTGGSFLFGPDGYLYIMVGDEWNPSHSQNKSSYFGVVHRIDVEGRTGNLEYGIPPDNPYISDPEAIPELYALGVRNPWKGSMDRGNKLTGEGYGRIFFGDVGQDDWEEVDMLQPASNYGWSAWEGPQCMDPPLCQDIGPTVPPLISYNHTIGQCVIGGHIYRSIVPGMEGWYIGADFGVSKFFGMYETGGGNWDWRWVDTCLTCNGLITRYPYYIHSIGVNENGDLFFASTDSNQAEDEAGSLYRIWPMYR